MKTYVIMKNKEGKKIKKRKKKKKNKEILKQLLNP